MPRRAAASHGQHHRSRRADLRIIPSARLDRLFDLGGGVLLIAAIALLWTGDWLLTAFSELLRRGLSVDLAGHEAPDVMGLTREVMGSVAIVLPPFAMLVVTLRRHRCHTSMRRGDRQR